MTLHRTNILTNKLLIIQILTESHLVCNLAVCIEWKVMMLVLVIIHTLETTQASRVKRNWSGNLL